jgi:hypothetical protein
MKYLIFSAIVVMLFNCGGIPKYKDDNLQPITHVKQIEGEFKNFDNDSLELRYNSLNGKLNWRARQIDTTQFTSVKFKILNEKRLKLDFMLEEDLVKSKIIKYRLRNNGFIKLRNRNLKVTGIPYIFGGYEMEKYDIGLTKTGDLILHGYNERAGGFLIVLSGGNAFKVKRTFERI